MEDDDEEEDVDMTDATELSWNAGEFAMAFFYMGQGDCCLVKCPDGAVIMIDCGSKANFPENTKVITENMLKIWASDKSIEYLILTHPDRDHYSKVFLILKGYKVKNVLFSLAYRDTSPLGRYKVSQVNQQIVNGYLKTETLREITLNQGNSYYKEWTSADRFKGKNPMDKKPIGLTGISIKNGTFNGLNWSVSLLAGNVPPTFNNDSDRTNSASLVTLLQIGDEKALIQGDATFATEAYLTNNHQALIANSNIVQAAHHGSGFSSGGKTYIENLNPQFVVVSVELAEWSHHLPDENVIVQYENCLAKKTQIEDHYFDYWHKAVASKDPNTRKWTNEAWQLLDKWKADGTLYETLRGGKYQLQNPGDNEYYLLDPGKGYMLYRQSTTLPIQETAMEGDTGYIFFTLNE